MGEIERVIWKVTITGIGIVAMLGIMKGMTNWTEQRSAEAKAETAKQQAIWQEKEEQEKDVENYIQSLHERETERRNGL